MSQPWVFAFEEGDGKDKQLLGGKGANLCEMTQIGLKVPPGFVISTEACRAYLAAEEQALPEALSEQIRDAMGALERKTGKRFGDPQNPLLVSVRSGSALSMPGMMDTILNLGLNRATLQGLIAQTDNPRFGYDAFRRFVQLFGKIALGIAHEHFDRPFEAVKARAGDKADVGLTAANLQEISESFLEVVREQAGREFPEDVGEQLELAVKAVFRSWLGKRAVDYRREFRITPDMADGTAVNVVAMVFGNLGDDCATGVAFTRNPGTGENTLYGEYLINAQGEDVVAGIRTPRPVQDLAEDMPETYARLKALGDRLEGHYREVQDFEFTIQNNQLYCLQTRNGKMNAAARVRTAVEMAEEGLVTRQEALARVEPETLEQLLHPRLDAGHGIEPVAQGLPASPGAVSGSIVFDADRAESLGREQPVILVREETRPDDIHGFFAARGILTSRGGKTSHAAVVARGMGKPCVAGAEGIVVNSENRQARVGEHVLHEGDLITIDGTSGNVYLGRIPTVAAEFSTELGTLLSWADREAEMGVMANADTPDGARQAVEFGAMGIGLCRTERMFNAPDRLPLVVDMILASDAAEREQALARLTPIQRDDFAALFRTLAPRPVTIRLLDPPIHEFLPGERELERQISDLELLRRTVAGSHELAASLDPDEAPGDSERPASDRVDRAIERKRRMLEKVRELTEVNPMLGHRGIRLGITHPEIYAMQIRAILEAAAQVAAEGLTVNPEIMVPQVCTEAELARVRTMVEEIGAEVGSSVRPGFGTMIEVVRACVRARHLAEQAEFFSFGTNDLTQAVFSFSREDAENKFLPFYVEHGLLRANPFEALDIDGVGTLMETAVRAGRGARPDLKVGICGEQAGHPESIRFCHRLGLSYVSCSPPRVPVARLSAAQAALAEPRGGGD